MENITLIDLSKSILITLPNEFRNKNWSESYGRIQIKLRNLNNSITEILIDGTKCYWADPLPLLSLIISLAEITNKQIEKKLYLPYLPQTSLKQKRFLAFIEKEGFLDNFSKYNIKLLTATENEEIYKSIDESYRLILKEYEKHLSYSDCSVIESKVIDLTSPEIKSVGIEKYIDNELLNVRHRFKSKILGTIEKETFNKVALFLKETIENVFEHAYDNNTKTKFVGYYLRNRHGLANSSLNGTTRNELVKIIHEEHLNSPRLLKWFVENTSGFFEIFVIDSGVGLTNNYFGEENNKRMFRQAWRETVGLGLRGWESPIKNTEFGGLYTLSRICNNNYLAGRDYKEWIGDELPILGENPDYASNKSYLNILTENHIQGLAIIGRITWKTLTDEHESWLKFQDKKYFDFKERDENPYLIALNETIDVYLKYYKNPFHKIIPRPFYIRDNRLKIEDRLLEKEYLAFQENVEFCLFLPNERLSKNKIFDIINDEIGKVNVSKKSIIVADIAVWEANLYQLALENARFSDNFIQKFNKIVLVTRRLSVCILTKKGNIYTYNENDSIRFIKSISPSFAPDKSLCHLVEFLRTHDSMLYWQHIKNVNTYGEYFLNKDIVWYQEGADIGLNGYLNFSQTLTDNFCKNIYEFSLERTLCLNNSQGCVYKSIDVLTNKLATQYNSLFYNTTSHNSQTILLGSVYVSGYSEKASSIDIQSTHSFIKIHFFQNQNINSNKPNNKIAQLLLWPHKGENWFKENLEILNGDGLLNNYRRVGTSHVIAPFGWKYFPIPRYRLFNKTTNKILNEYSLEQVNNKDYEFISIYKCTPPDTYNDWQGVRTQILSIGHICYESNHDIIKIDFPFIINESFITGGKLSQFLTSEFLLALGADENSVKRNGNDRLLNGVKKYIQQEKETNKTNIAESAVIVYPYHFNSDYVVSTIKEHINPELHNRIIALFPLNKERSDATFLTSPLTIETIRKKIKEFSNKNPNKEVNILLFDDATILGKTRKEIKHILFSLGAKSITSVTILERLRLPFSTSDPRFNKAYWRLDIPKLGSSDSCPICNVLSTLNNIQSNIASDNILKRIKEIQNIWKETTPYEVNENSIISPTQIELKGAKLLKRFGIYFDGEKHHQCGGEANKIEITNSLGLTIYVSELHSMTSRDDIVFEYIANDEINIYAKIEMLSTYILLFGKELSNITQNRIIKELFLMCNSIDTNNHTSFALISLLSQGSNKLECLYEVCKDSGESDIKIGNQDLQILCSILSLNPNSKFANSNSLKRLHKKYKNLKDLYKQFHSEIFNDYGIKHDTPLQLIVKMEYTLTVVREAEDACDKISYLLKEIPKWYFRNDEDESSEFMNIDNRIENLLNEYKYVSTNIVDITQSESLEKLNRIAIELFSVLLPIHNKLFICVGLNQKNFPLVGFVNEVIQASGLEIGVSEEFKKLLITDETLQLERWIIWDRDVVRKMGFLFNNVRYSNEKIEDPFGMNGVKMQGWISVEYFENDNRLSIIIFNKSDKQSKEIKELTSKKIKPEKLHLRELEISIDYEDIIINQQDILKTIISFPYI